MNDAAPLAPEKSSLFPVTTLRGRIAVFLVGFFVVSALAAFAPVLCAVAAFALGAVAVLALTGQLEGRPFIARWMGLQGGGEPMRGAAAADLGIAVFIAAFASAGFEVQRESASVVENEPQGVANASPPTAVNTAE